MSYVDYIKAYSLIKYEQFKDNLNKKSVPSINSKQREILTELKLKGIVVLTDYYKPEYCDIIIKEIDEMISNDYITKIYDEVKSDSRIFASHLHSESIMKFHNDPFLKKIGEAYTKNELVNSHTLGARLEAKENNLGSGGGWHRDSVYQVQYKSIAYLTDVKESNGPFEYIKGSQKKSSVLKSIQKNNFKAHHNRFTEEEVDLFMNSNPELKKELYTAKKGSVILVDTSGIHRGMPIKEGKRYALTNYYFLSHQYNSKAKARFEKLF